MLLRVCISSIVIWEVLSNGFQESTAVETLQNQFSGYGSTSQVVARCLDKIGIKESLEHWSNETVEVVVNAFIDEKFPTVLALNKIDHPDSDKVGYIPQSQDKDVPCVLTNLRM